MRHTTVPAVLIAAFLSACATGNMKTLDTSKPIQMDEGPYRQDNQPLLMSDLEDKLADHPAAKSQMDGYKAKKWTGLLLGTAGGAVLGWNVGDNLTKKGEKTWTPAIVGAGAVVLALPFALMADSQLRSAAEAYNGSFTQQQSSVPVSATPFVTVVPGAEGGKQYTAGVTGSF